MRGVSSAPAPRRTSMPAVRRPPVRVAPVRRLAVWAGVGRTAAPLVGMWSGSLCLHPRERLLDALGRQPNDEVHDAPLLASEGALVRLLLALPLLVRLELVHTPLEHLEPPQDLLHPIVHPDTLPRRAAPRAGRGRHAAAMERASG